VGVKVIINGAFGKMGKTAVAAIADEKDLQLVACASRDDDLTHLIKQHQADVVIDFTTPAAVFDNTKKIIEAGARPVVGTTGLTDAQIEMLSSLCADKKRGAMIVPNFSIGAILMMRFAKEAAKHFHDVEIIEYHNPHKKDKPSGTALKTAILMGKKDVPIHSVRMSGVFANQDVIFGGPGETLTLRHVASDRTTMMPGLFLCCRKVMQLDHLVFGMENIIG
jgi:4-hydroxy-tetrahydrodipicolinate reductase